MVTHLWFKNGSYMEYQPIGGTIHKLQENAAAASMPAGEICTFHHPIHYTSDDLRLTFNRYSYSLSSSIIVFQLLINLSNS